MSKNLFKTIRNKIVSNTGESISDKSIALVIYLYEESKVKSTQCVNNKPLRLTGVDR